ncbi:twin-arginine translocase subunit TatC [Altererythrobacter sp. RZ02]|uniref:Sec-independent protein translocase protein TatC n=1 Tax=Pontixanthobacter rizhaonensis TaxID=2730337 RepID=A0A848QIZ9_9SPHN|nr:twin-arginine translocase subunit TatC [Pontixanthobacter rizhaonensis]NMW30770.1 twin-arginine translocase subunit TatC [Pontixanthobacter rizhaonensis]
MALGVDDIDETQAPLLDHLIELRGRLVRCVIALVIGFGIGLYFANEVYGFLVRPLEAAFPPGEGKLIYTKLYEAFFVQLKVALFAGFFMTFPIIANQLWAFVAPGLYAKEKKAFLPFLFATPVLFGAGAALAYYIVMPTAFRWFIGFEGVTGGIELEALPAAGEYLSLVMQFILAFGISFLLPVLLLLLNKAGIVDRQQLAGARRYVIVLVVALSAIVTPPDPGSQLILAVPLLFLFEGSLLIMRFSEPKKADSDTEEEPESA